MRIITRIVIALDIKDVIGVHASDDALINIVRHKYVGKCWMGMWIESINSIIKQGECIINQYGSPSFGTMSLGCEVVGIRYSEGEIIHGCRVVGGNKDATTASTDVAEIMVGKHPLFESITAGQTISVEVVGSRYWPTTNKISVNAIPFLPSKITKIYHLIPSGPLDGSLFIDVLERIDEEEKNAEKNKGTKAEEFFSALLNVMGVVCDNKNVRNIRDIITGTVLGYITYQDPAKISINDNIPDIEDKKVITGLKPEAIIVNILEDYCTKLRTLREYIEIYSNPEMLNAHKNLWQIFKKNQS